VHARFWSENQKRRDQSEDLSVDGKMILECILGEIGWEGVGCMHLV
jgi:hypothetical protein